MPQLNRSQLAAAKRLAKKHGVEVEYSTRKNKKLDVFIREKSNGSSKKTRKRKVASIGDVRYSDFLQHKDPERRRRYKIRHNNYRHRRNTPGWYADKILW